jgi:hypothetical protein
MPPLLRCPGRGCHWEAAPEDAAIWFPLNYLLISALERYHRFFGDELTVEYPTGGPRRPSTGPGCRRR